MRGSDKSKAKVEVTQNDVEPATINDFIAKITNWYSTDYQGFRTIYEKTIQHVVPFPSDTPPYYQYDWKGANFETLCEFFKEWYKLYVNPDPDPSSSSSIFHGLDYIVKFSWLSYENNYGLTFLTCGPGYQMAADFTNLQGKYMDSGDSSTLAAQWEEQIGTKGMADYKRPPDGFKNLNQFFIRELVDPSKRPIAPQDADESVVVASADCVINMIVDKLTETTPIPVKSVTMNVNELLHNSSHASKFVGGTAVSCILMPDTYHWYHAPVGGTVVESSDDIDGLYYGMRDFPDLLNKGNVGYGYDYSMFEDFRRGYLIIDTGNPHYGLVGMVPVGLNSIASVQFEDKFKGITSKKDGVPVKKGDRIGNFQYGGSLNILLFEPQVFPALQLLQGQRIGRLEERHSERSLRIFSSFWHRPSRRDRF